MRYAIRMIVDDNAEVHKILTASETAELQQYLDNNDFDEQVALAHRLYQSVGLSSEYASYSWEAA